MKDTIKHLKELEAQATPGPWGTPKRECDTFGNCPLQLAYEYEGWREDAQLIAEMRNALPSILDQLEAAEGVVKALHKEREKNRKLMAVVESVKQLVRQVDGMILAHVKD